MTNEESATKSVDEKLEEVVEAPKLDRRDAIEVAIAAHKEPDAEIKTKSGSENRRAESADKVSSNKDQTIVKKDETLLEAPAQWTKEEKEDFKNSSRKQQEAALRLHQSRDSTLSELTRRKQEVLQAEAELQWAKDIAKQVEPFLKVRGSKEPVHAQIIKALEAVNQLDTGDPLVNAAEYIKAKGKEVPKALLDAIAATSAPTSDPQIASLRKDLDDLKLEKIKEGEVKRNQELAQTWNSFITEKNAAGIVKYPSLDPNTEEGLKLARNIGSLVYDKSPLSESFIANAQARIPNLTWPRLFEEAYRYFGGKVDETPAPRTDSQEDKQLHLVKSNRAASSQPGRGTATSSGPVKKFSSRREALAAAYATLKEQEES